MLSLVYVSSATVPFSESDLLLLMSKARENNVRVGVTGMLLYQEGCFIQVLEGPEDAVRRVFARISTDPRHRETIVLCETEIEEREFGEWAMGFRNLKDPSLKELAGYSEFLNEPLNAVKLQSNSARARGLLAMFHQNMVR